MIFIALSSSKHEDTHHPHASHSIVAIREEKKKNPTYSWSIPERGSKKNDKKKKDQKKKYKLFPIERGREGKRGERKHGSYSELSTRFQLGMAQGGVWQFLLSSYLVQFNTPGCSHNAAKTTQNSQEEAQSGSQPFPIQENPQ